jgi:hypothetical protein
MDKARAEQWMNMYSILDRSTLEKAVFELIKESLVDFHLVRYLIDEVQIGSVDSVSKSWEDIFTTFPVYSRPIRFEYIAHCIQFFSSISRTAFSRYIQQIVTMLPSIIRVCRLHIRCELR